MVLLRPHFTDNVMASPTPLPSHKTQLGACSEVSLTCNGALLEAIMWLPKILFIRAKVTQRKRMQITILTTVPLLAATTTCILPVMVMRTPIRTFIIATHTLLPRQPFQLAEVEVYQLQLVKPSNAMTSTVGPAVTIFPSTKSEPILGGRVQDLIKDVVPVEENEELGFTLLYRASRDGVPALEFYNRCDGCRS